ncbi:hypothetical protein Q7P35_011295 [Cladosporium inversicolor]
MSDQDATAPRTPTKKKASRPQSPVPLHDGEIRVLTLHAAEVLGPIVCSLQVVVLDERPQYEALSYTWGDPDVREKIFVDDVEVDVTVNLEISLRNAPRALIWLGCDAGECNLHHCQDVQLQCDSKLLKEGGSLSLDLCHKHYGHRKCQDPRDKIYGMLGLISHDSGEIVPDYSEPVQSVYYRATCELLAAPLGGLQSLGGFQYGPAPEKWAYWVRDFDRQWTHAGGSSTLSDYEKWSTWPCLPKERPNQLALAVTGRCIGTLETVCQEVCQPRLGLSRSTFKAWLQVADFDSEAHAAGRRTQTNERIWRTVVGGVILQGTDPRRFKSDEDMVLLDSFVSWVETGEVPYALLPTISIPTASRTYCRSQDGDHGLCYPTCRPGGQVWVLHGSTVPFVLRPVDVDTNVEAKVVRPSEASLEIAVMTGSWMAKG